MHIEKKFNDEDGRQVQIRILSNFKISELLEELSIMQAQNELTMSDCCNIAELARIMLHSRLLFRLVVRLERRVEGYRPISYALEVVPANNTAEIAAAATISQN